MQIRVSETGPIPFDSRNSFISSLSLVEPLDHEAHAQLHAQVKKFNAGIPGDELRPRFFLEFTMANDVYIMHIRQSATTRAPTRELFDELLTDLGIITTETAAVATQVVATPPGKPSDFEAATGRRRGPRGRFLPANLTNF